MYLVRLPFDGKTAYSDSMIPLTSIPSFRIFENLKESFTKLILFLDRAPQHRSSNQSQKAYLEKNNDVMTVEYLPRGSSEL